MAVKRTDRLNSLLREVISEVIRLDVEDPDLLTLLTVTRVDITRDLRYAKVYISVIGDDEVRTKTIKALEKASGFIAVNSAKKVTMRYFPDLTFKLDTGVDQQMRIEEMLADIEEERSKRPENNSDDPADK
jgi:ribosome-binding factor A